MMRCSRNPASRVRNLALKLLGRLNDEIRLPMLPVQQESTKSAILAALVHAGLLN